MNYLLLLIFKKLIFLIKRLSLLTQSSKDKKGYEII